MERYREGERGGGVERNKRAKEIGVSGDKGEEWMKCGLLREK